MVKILFVCSGNIFRSVSVEYCLKDYLKKNKIKNLEVSSAGITAMPQEVASEVKETLASFGIDINKHKQRKLIDKIIKENDLIVAMGENHKKFIKEKFGVNSVYLLKFVII